ncbi:MAG: hypothetical protein AABM67_13230 [Acidobacteriota bacterium]
MIRKRLLVIASLLVLCFSGAAVAQSSLEHLRGWAGKYPTEKKGRITKKFFNEPQVRTPLLRLLNRTDFELLTREYSVEAPIKEIGDYLAVKVCKPHDCGDEQAGYAINLKTGTIYVRMQLTEQVRWFASKGNENDLPKEVQEFLGDFGSQ